MEIWFQDEARLGQKNGLTRLWARKGTRPRQPADQRYHNAYLFGAICPAHGKGAALMLPWADAQAMQMHLDEISRHVARKAHAVVLMDRAGWHTTGKLKVPKNLTIISRVDKPSKDRRKASRIFRIDNLFIGLSSVQNERQSSPLQITSQQRIKGWADAPESPADQIGTGGRIKSESPGGCARNAQLELKL